MQPYVFERAHDMRTGTPYAEEATCDRFDWANTRRRGKNKAKESLAKNAYEIYVPRYVCVARIKFPTSWPPPNQRGRLGDSPSSGTLLVIPN